MQETPNFYLLKDNFSMKSNQINRLNVTAVAELMNRLKPEWWTIEGALVRLNNGIGWYLTSDDRVEPIG